MDRIGIIMATVATIIWFGLGFAQADTGGQSAPSPKPKVVGRVYGCQAEDDCYADYRGDPLGRGVWVIVRGQR